MLYSHVADYGDHYLQTYHTSHHGPHIISPATYHVCSWLGGVCRSRTISGPAASCRRLLLLLLRLCVLHTAMSSCTSQSRSEACIECACCIFCSGCGLYCYSAMLLYRTTQANLCLPDAWLCTAREEHECRRSPIVLTLPLHLIPRSNPRSNPGCSNRLAFTHCHSLCTVQ